VSVYLAPFCETSPVVKPPTDGCCQLVSPLPSETGSRPAASCPVGSISRSSPVGPRMDSRDSNVQQNHPTLCKNGCGFYSNAGNEGLCSVCYKDIVKKKQAPPTNMPASFSPAPNSMANLSLDAESQLGFSGQASSLGACASLDTGSPTVPCILATEPEPEAGGSEDKEGGQDGRKKKNRCASCKKKLGLTGFTCRCGGLFCSIHRYSDKHQCGFDYKALGAEEITRSNPVVVAQKVAKI